MRLREGLRSNRRCDVSVLARIMEDYAFLCIYASRRNALNSAESGFRQRASHSLCPISSFSAAPAVTGVLCPDVPSGRFGVLIAHMGHYRKLPASAAADRFAAAAGVRPGMLSGRHNGP